MTSSSEIVSGVTKEVVAFLNAIGTDAKVDEWDHVLIGNPVTGATSQTLHLVYGATKATRDNLYIRIGYRFANARFPQKNGKFNIANIARRLLETHNARIARQAQVKIEEAAEAASEKLLAQVQAPLAEVKGLQIKTAPWSPGKLYAEFHRDLTPNQIKALHGLLDSFDNSDEWKE